MDLASLLRNVKQIKFEDLVWQDSIKTEKDKKYWQDKGYRVLLTEDEFKDKFDIPTTCVAYTPSFADSTIYLNRETLATCVLHLELILKGIVPDSFNIDVLMKTIEKTESYAKDGDFVRSILHLPDGLRIGYFNLLVDKIEKEGLKVADLYSLFCDFYTMSDFGFNDLSSETFNLILGVKTDVEKERTNRALSVLPNRVKIFRGQTLGISADEEQAHSWTLDVNVANFFASRLGNEESEILEGFVDKAKIKEYFEDSNEKEVWVDYKDIELVGRTRVFGSDYIERQLPKVSNDYIVYKGLRSDIGVFKRDGDHSFEHTLRVLLWTLLMCAELGLSEDEQDILAIASLFHDVGRVNDSGDLGHGKWSRRIFEANKDIKRSKEKRAIIGFLIEFHCRDDEDGYREIENNAVLSESRFNVELLYKVFKDCDALDRVRFGLRGLDLEQLRIPVSTQLSKVARIIFEQLKG